MSNNIVRVDGARGDGETKVVTPKKSEQRSWKWNWKHAMSDFLGLLSGRTEDTHWPSKRAKRLQFQCEQSGSIV